MSNRESADVVFNPGTSRQVRLMLAAKDGQGDKGRAWQEQRVPRKASKNNSNIEGTLEWLSWHSGAAHGRVIETGIMPPVYAAGTMDVRYQHLGLLPPAKHLVLGTYQTRFVFDHAGVIWSVGKNATGTNWVLSQINVDTLAISSVDLGPDGEPLSVVHFDGVVYIGMGFDVGVMKIANNGVVTQSTGAVKWAYAAVLGAKLYFNTTNNIIRNVSTAADPFNSGNWSGVISTGDDVPITSLSGLVRVLYIGREDGLNGLDTDLNLVSLLPELRMYRSADNLKVMVPWHGALLVQHSRGLFYYTEGLVQMVGVERIRTNTTKIQVVVRGLAADGEWVWAIGQGPDVGERFRYFLMCGRERNGQEPGEGPIAWIVLGEWLAEVETYTGLKMTVSVLGGNRLWFPDPTTGQAAYIPLADMNAPPRTPGVDGDFEMEADLDLPVVNMGSPMVPKYLKSVEIDAAHTAPDRGFTVWVADSPNVAEPEFTQLGGVVEADERTEILIPDTLTPEAQVRIRAYTDDPTQSPVLKRVALNYTERPEKNTIVTLVGELGVGKHGSGGGEMQRRGRDELDRLYALEGLGPQVVLDPFGGRRNYLVLEVSGNESESREDPSTSILQVQVVLERV